MHIGLAIIKKQHHTDIKYRAERVVAWFKNYTATRVKPFQIRVKEVKLGKLFSSVGYHILRHSFHSAFCTFIHTVSTRHFQSFPFSESLVIIYLEQQWSTGVAAATGPRLRRLSLARARLLTWSIYPPSFWSFGASQGSSKPNFLDLHRTPIFM